MITTILYTLWIFSNLLMWINILRAEEKLFIKDVFPLFIMSSIAPLFLVGVMWDETITFKKED